MNKKALYTFCLVGWSILLIVSIVNMCMGVKVHPGVAFWPTLICVFHYIDKLIENR